MTKDERHHAPSDLELMLYFDGELDDPRKSEVAAFVNADLRSQSKLAGLRMSSALVEAQAREMAAGPSPTRSPADDIANLVLAKIEAEGPFARTTSGDPSRTASADPPTAKVIPFPVRNTSKSGATSGDRSHAATPAKVPSHRSRPASENARRILGVAALAVAAAAALAIWGKQAAGPGAPPGVQVAQTAPSSAPSPLASPAPTSAQPQVDVAAVAEGDEEHGVEVAAVNFGAHMGSIFYVPSGSIEANHTTTVVWLADDAGE